jgi:hypothetical protein
MQLCIHCENYTAVHAVDIYTFMIPTRAPVSQPIVTVVTLGVGGGERKEKKMVINA